MYFVNCFYLYRVIYYTHKATQHGQAKARKGKIMKIINTVTNEVISEIITNHSMTLDEAIELVGEIINNEDDERFSFDGDNVIIDGNRYWYEELGMEW